MNYLCKEQFYNNNIDKILLIQHIWKNKPLLKPVSHINVNIDIGALKMCIKTYMSSDRISYYNSTATCNIELESGFSEWWISKVTNGKKISAGNSPMDVITFNNHGIDVMCVCMNNNLSNEKSMIQNFKGSGNNLDIYFENKEYDKAVKLFMNDLQNKLNIFKNNNNIDKLFYVVFISTSTNIYLSILQLDIKYIKNVYSSGATVQKKSINILNIIDNKYGCAKLYKSKKRVELRFTKQLLEHTYTIKLF